MYNMRTKKASMVDTSKVKLGDMVGKTYLCKEGKDPKETTFAKAMLPKSKNVKLDLKPVKYEYLKCKDKGLSWKDFNKTIPPKGKLKYKPLVSEHVNRPDGMIELWLGGSLFAILPKNVFLSLGINTKEKIEKRRKTK